MPNLRFTLRVWPVIALATIGLSFLTQQVADWCGIALPEQTNIALVKRCLAQAFASWKAFGVAAFLVAQVLLIMPVIEEVVFRWGLFKWFGKLVAVRLLSRRHSAGQQACDLDLQPRPLLFAFSAFISSALFSAAHYIAQPWPDNAFLALFFFGLAQCWLYRRTKRLWCVILNHLLFNLTNLLLLPFAA